MAERAMDKKLYSSVKKLADKKFSSKTGVYKSSWIVREYKRKGGRFRGSKPSGSTGLQRWYREKWVDLNRPIRSKSGKTIGYKSCGRSRVKNSKEKYPLCRPSRKITSKTPKTYRELSSRRIESAKRKKSKVKGRKNIKF
jgi:hypothetical protein